MYVVEGESQSGCLASRQVEGVRHRVPSSVGELRRAGKSSRRPPHHTQRVSDTLKLVCGNDENRAVLEDEADPRQDRRRLAQ